LVWVARRGGIKTSREEMERESKDKLPHPPPHSLAFRMGFLPLPSSLRDEMLSEEIAGDEAADLNSSVLPELPDQSGLHQSHTQSPLSSCELWISPKEFK
jgi:hypothetical protein